MQAFGVKNTSCQGPEHVHIDLIKSIAHLTNNKDVFLCILRYPSHCRRGHVQQYEKMLEDMLDENAGDARKLAMDQDKIEQALTCDRYFSIACELGVRYPTLKAMLSRGDLHIRTSVRHITNVIYHTYDQNITFLSNIKPVIY